MRQAGFELVRGGYAVAEVDEYLDALEERVLVAQGRPAGRRGRADPASEAEFLKAELTASVHEAVPARLRSCAAATTSTTSTSSSTGSSAPSTAPTRSRSRTSGSVPFRPRRGGYREDAVDDAMDRVVEYLLLVRREGTAAASSRRRDPAD